MLCLFTAGFQTMSIYNSPLLLVFYSLLGLRAKTPERPLVIFFFGSLKQPVYFCRLVCNTFQIKHHHPSVVFFLMFSNSLFQPLASFCTHCSQFHEPHSPKGPHSWLPLFYSFSCPKLGSASFTFVSQLWFPLPDCFGLIQYHRKSSGDFINSADA